MQSLPQGTGVWREHPSVSECSQSCTGNGDQTKSQSVLCDTGALPAPKVNRKILHCLKQSLPKTKTQLWLSVLLYTKIQNAIGIQQEYCRWWMLKISIPGGGGGGKLHTVNFYLGPVNSSSKPNISRYQKETHFKELKIEELVCCKRTANFSVYIPPPPRPPTLKAKIQTLYWKQSRITAPLPKHLKIPRKRTKREKAFGALEERPWQKQDKPFLERNLYLRSTECRYCCSSCPNTGSSTGPSS